MPSLSILIVEDNLDHTELIGRSLKQTFQDLDLHTTTTLSEAQDYLTNNRIDLVIIDYLLPDGDGIDLLSQSPKSHTFPAIILTGQGNERIAVQALKAGAQDYVVKSPDIFEQMPSIVDQVLKDWHHISARQKAEAELKALAEKFEHQTYLLEGLLSASIDPIYMQDKDGTFLYVSPSGAQVLGVPAEDIVGKTGKDLKIPSDILVRFSDQRRSVFTTGNPITDEIELPTVNGPRNYEYLLSPVYNNTIIEANICIFRDITERKQMEEERIRTQRLRAIGELSAGISHNLNNILTGVLGPAQILRRTVEDPTVQEELDFIIESAQHATAIVKNLHRGVSRVVEKTEPVDVNRMIKNTIKATRPRWKDQSEAQGIAIQIQTHLSKNLPFIKGTSSGLHDILLNLIFNAVDAMPKGGNMTISTQNTDHKVQIIVADTGIGMTEDTRQRIFEPFFTTKMDVGTGLGLATVYGTLESWGGHIAVESTPKMGTTFTIDLPPMTTTVAEEKSNRDTTASTPSGKFLIIDDDTRIGYVFKRILSPTHKVETATSHHMLDTFVPSLFDVIFVDLGLPDMPGDKLAHLIRQKDPGVVLILMTGWQLAQYDSRRLGFDFYLQKPFDDLTELDTLITKSLLLRADRLGLTQ